MKKIVLFITLCTVLVGCSKTEAPVVYLMDTIECENYHITIDTMEFTYEINPITKDGAYTSYVSSEEDTIFFHVVLEITNIMEEVDLEQEVDLLLTHDETTYFSQDKIELENNFATNCVTSQDTYMHFIFQVPYSISEDGLALDMSLYIGDDEYVLEDQNDITNPESYQEAMMAGYQEVEVNEAVEIEGLCNLKVTTIEYSNLVEPSNHDYFYTFYDVSEEECEYGHVVFEVEYVGEEAIELEDFIEVLFVLEDYQSYLGSLFIEESDGTDFITSDFDEIEPGDTVVIHAISKIEDDKIIDSNVLRFIVGEQKYCMIMK